MTKEQELMAFLHKNVFDRILSSKDADKSIKSGVNLTIARMNKLSAKSMITYFWSAIANETKQSKLLKEAGLPRFEDVREEFKACFNDEWLKA